MQRTTIREIAARAGVSVATVDRVLHRRLPVREDTAARVAAAARELDYGALPVPRSAVRAGFLLQRSASDFYRQLERDLAQALADPDGAGVTGEIAFCDEVEPIRIAQRIAELGARVDALAVVAVDDPRVTDAIGELAAHDLPVISMLSELSAPACRGYVGISNRAAGRTAGWAVARCAKAPGPVGVLIGSHGYLGHEDREIGFRSYFREHGPQFAVLEPVVCLDDPELAAAATRELLAREPAIVALYVAGGGEAGAIRVLDSVGAPRRPACVCHELSPHTRGALMSGTVAVALAQDTREIARRAVAQLGALARGDERAAAPGPVAFTVHTSENP